MVWLQALTTLSVLLQNVPITAAGSAVGAWRLVALGESYGTVPQRVCAVICYAFALIFICFVQLGYVKANWRKVRRGPSYVAGNKDR